MSEESSQKRGEDEQNKTKKLPSLKELNRREVLTKTAGTAGGHSR